MPDRVLNVFLRGTYLLTLLWGIYSVTVLYAYLQLLGYWHILPFKIWLETAVLTVPVYLTVAVGDHLDLMHTALSGEAVRRMKL